jgi:hypothetical protein
VIDGIHLVKYLPIVSVGALQFAIPQILSEFANKPVVASRIVNGNIHTVSAPHIRPCMSERFGAIFTKPSHLCDHANLLFGPIHPIVHWLLHKIFAWPQSYEGFV